MTVRDQTPTRFLRPDRNRRLVLAAVALLAGATTLGELRPSNADTAPAVQQGLSAPVQAWVSAVEAGDAVAIARMNGPDTIAYVPDAMVLKGTDEIGKAYAGMFEKFTAKVKITDAHYVEAGGLVSSWGLYTLVLTPKAGGSDIVLNGRFSDLAFPADGGWRYVVDHASLPAGQ